MSPSREGVLVKVEVLWNFSHSCTGRAAATAANSSTNTVDFISSTAAPPTRRRWGYVYTRVRSFTTPLYIDHYVGVAISIVTSSPQSLTMATTSSCDLCLTSLPFTVNTQSPTHTPIACTTHSISEQGALYIAHLCRASRVH